MTATTIITTTVASIPQQHGGQHKKCNSATCCSPSKIWRAIQTAISADDKEGLTLMFQNQERVPHIKNVLIKERNINDASALPPSHKHRILQFDKTVRLDATKKFGKSVTDLNGLQVALFHGREDIACQLLYFLRQHASPTELDSFLGHVWGKGNSSLHLACFHGMPRLVQLLLEMGADPHVTNACHFKPADCCKDPGCLAVLEKATTSLTKAPDHEQHDDPDSSVDLVSPAQPSLGGRRRASGGLLGLPTSRSFSTGLKRQGALPGANSSRSFASSAGSAEKKIKSGISSAIPPATPITRSPLVSLQEQSTEEAPKVSSVLASLHDDNNTPGQQGEADIKQLPPPVMRQSFALRPTPETERPVCAPEAEQIEEESPPATGTAITAQQQQQQQREEKQQQCQSANATPTVPGDPINRQHHSESFHHSTEVIGQESASSPRLSVLSSATSDDGSNGPAVVTLVSPAESTRTRTTTLTSMCPKQFDEVDEGRRQFASPLLPSAVADKTLVPDIGVDQQLSSPPLLHQQQGAIKAIQGPSFKVSVTDQNYQEQQTSERMEHQRNNRISTTAQSRSHQKNQAIATRVNNPDHQSYPPDGK